MTMALGLVRADTPHWFLIAGLLVFGFFRSLQFTCMNALSYADLTEANVSTGSSVASVGQQLSSSFGIAIAATLLALFGTGAGQPTAADFVPTFVCVGLLPIVSLAFFTRLRPEDGSQVSGHLAVRRT
jgi:hypothetical protein